MLQHRRMPFWRKPTPDVDGLDGALAETPATQDEPVITKHMDMFDVEANEVIVEEERPLFALKPLPPADIGRPSLFAVEPSEGADLLDD